MARGLMLGGERRGDEAERIDRWLHVHLPSAREASVPLAELGVDSFTVLELVVAVEEDFDIALPERLPASLRTVGDLRGWLLRVTERRRA